MASDTPRHTGLTESEARRRLATDGPNELSGERRRGLMSIALEVLREPMFMLLSAGGVIYFALGDIREALVLLLSVVVVTGITIHQTRKTERALDALRELSNPHALVVRDGNARRIAGRDVVRGDVMLLQEGDRVAADARLLEANDLSVDEALLTGESLPCVRSQPRAIAPQ
jgi:P-type Ca2+ transporter type 2C